MQGAGGHLVGRPVLLYRGQHVVFGALLKEAYPVPPHVFGYLGDQLRDDHRTGIHDAPHPVEDEHLCPLAVYLDDELFPAARQVPVERDRVGLVRGVLAVLAGVDVAVFGVGRIAKDAQRPGRAGHRLFFERDDAVHPVELEVERRELAGPQSNACILQEMPRCLAKAASSADRRPYWHPTSTRRSGPPSQRHSMAFLSAEGMAQTLPGPGADGFLPDAMSRS